MARTSTERSGPVRCAIYTRKSTEEGLDQAFNSLDAQYEACAAYIVSQRHEGWTLHKARYDDGGFSGGSMERPGLKRLLKDVDTGIVDVIVVYKVDRLTRSLADLAYDLGSRALRPPPAADSAIVAIDERSLQALGRWPWRRSVHAELLTQLQAAGVRSVAFGLLLTEASPSPQDNDDRLLAEALGRFGRVVLPVAPAPAASSVAI